LRANLKNFMKRFNTKAILIGTLTMLVLDLLSGVVSFIVFSGDALSAGATQADITAVAKIIEQDTAYLLFSLLIGTLSTVTGAYVAARLAKNLPLFNACAVGVLGLLAGVLLGAQSESPWWFNTLGYLFTVPAALVGGWLARRDSTQAP
jgi:hypothetical protein